MGSFALAMYATIIHGYEYYFGVYMLGDPNIDGQRAVTLYTSHQFGKTNRLLARIFISASVIALLIAVSALALDKLERNIGKIIVLITCSIGSMTAVAHVGQWVLNSRVRMQLPPQGELAEMRRELLP